MRGNTIQIELPLKRGKVSKTIPLYQFDYGQKLIITGAELPAAYEVHFANEMHGDAVTSIGGENGVLIPDSVLTSGEPVYLWLYLHEDSTDGETEFQGIIPVIKRARISDQTPTPEEQSAITQAIAALNSAVTVTTAAKDEAIAAQTHIENLSVSAESAAPEAGASVTKTVNAQGEVNLAFAIPRGDKGDTGDQGIQGEPGNDGSDGTDGFSPVVSLTKSGDTTTLSITDANGEQTVEILDGSDGDPTEIIDDTAGDGDTDKTWSANKLNDAIGGKADVVSGATSGNFAGLDSNGNLTDSGHKHSDYLTSHQDITGKADKANPEFTGSISLGRKSGSTVGANSVAVGQGLVADSKNQAVFGQYNKVDEIPAWAANTHYYVGDLVYNTVMGKKLCSRCITENTDSSFDSNKWENYGPQNINSKYAFAFGGGTAATQGEKNIFDIDWNGNGEFTGDLTINKGKENEVSVSSLKTEINSSGSLAGVIGETKVTDKDIPAGTSMYKDLLTVADLKKDVQYTVSVKLTENASKNVYLKLTDEEDTTIGSSFTIGEGEASASRSIVPSSDYKKAILKTCSADEYTVEAASVSTYDNIVNQLGTGITGDSVTAITYTTANSKRIDGNGNVVSADDSSYYVTDDIPVVAHKWYMISASAGYANSYYSWFDEDHVPVMFERSPSGSATNIKDKMICAPTMAKYIRIAYISNREIGKIALCSTVKTNLSGVINDSAGESDYNTAWSAGKTAELIRHLNESGIAVDSLFGSAFIKDKQVPTGVQTYTDLVRINLKKNTNYTLILQLKNAVSKNVSYYLMQKDNTIIGYANTLTAGSTFASIAVTSPNDYDDAKLTVYCGDDIDVKYAAIIGSESIITNIAEIAVGDNITILGSTSVSNKSISGTGAVTEEQDSTYFVTNEIEVSENKWYMLTASAGYGKAYYAIYDASHNVITVSRSPGGAVTTIANKMVYTPARSKYIRIAYISNVTDGLIALCDSLKIRKRHTPEWWGKFIEISYSSIGIAATNSLETYISAGHFGFPVCKGDVRPTSDDKLIMCHDAGFTFDGNGRITTYSAGNSTAIRSLTHDQCMEFEFDERATATENNHYQKVTDIDGFLDVCKQYNMIAFVTVRDEYIDVVCAEVLAALKRHSMMERAIINGYTPKTLTLMRMMNDSIPLSFIMNNDFALSEAVVNRFATFGNSAITLVSNPSNMRTYLSGIESAIDYALSKGVSIFYSAVDTAEDLTWLREHCISGAQINYPILPYRFEQVKFKVAISSSTATIEGYRNIETIDATLSQSGNTISISEFTIPGSTRGFPDLIMEYWMNRFAHRITAESEGGNSVTAKWQNNALKLTVSDISVDDTIDVIIEV